MYRCQYSFINFSAFKCQLLVHRVERKRFSPKNKRIQVHELFSQQRFSSVVLKHRSLKGYLVTKDPFSPFKNPYLTMAAKHSAITCLFFRLLVLLLNTSFRFQQNFVVFLINNYRILFKMF